MPILKPIAGHGSCKGIRRYLEKGERALARDLLNLPLGEWIEEAGGRELRPFAWDEEMDKTRRDYGTDTPWKGREARTFKHFVISPDPCDNIDLPSLRSLAQAWASKYFPNHEIAIVYHDDNAANIPHAHIVVNNVDLVTGYRMQTQFPKDLNRDLQDMARERNLLGLDNDESCKSVSERPRSRQAVYFGRSEREILQSGNYSWVGDIRSRVALAKNTSRSEREFREALTSLGIEMADNSSNARRADWVFSLSDHPTWKVSGERLGLSFGKAMLLMRFERQEAYHPTLRTEREIKAMAKEAVELNDLQDLSRLSASLETCAKFNVRTMDDFERRMSTLKRRGNEGSEGFRRLEAARDYMQSKKLMPTAIEDASPKDPVMTRRRGLETNQAPTRAQEEQRVRSRERGR